VPREGTGGGNWRCMLVKGQVISVMCLERMVLIFSGDFVIRIEVIEGKKEELGAARRVIVFKHLSAIRRIYIYLRAHFQF
jgi:hypothetical protein